MCKCYFHTQIRCMNNKFLITGIISFPFTAIVIHQPIHCLMKLPPEPFFLIVVGNEHHGVENSYNVADTHVLP